MPRNKDRLYIALYVRSNKPRLPGALDTYHWALLLAPKFPSHSSTHSTRFHAKNPSGRSDWIYEETPLTPSSLPPILVRILVAKVVDSERLKQILRAVPLVQGDAAWTCIAWVRGALEAVGKAEGVLGRGEVRWDLVKEACMAFAGRLREEGRFAAGSGGEERVVPTWDLLGQREVGW